MSSELSETEERLLEFLTSREKEEDQVRFSIGEALDQLKISRDELDEALLRLESKGFVKIIRISPSKKLIEEIRKRLTELDYPLLSGELSHEEYLKKREEVIGILSSVPKEVEELTPLPPATIDNIIEGLRNSCSHLRSLVEHRREQKSSNFKELLDTYEGILRDSASLLSRYANALSSFVEKTRREIEGLQGELEVFAADRTRKADLSAIKSEKLRKLDEAKEKLRCVAKVLSLGSAEAKVLPAEEVERLRKEVEKLKFDLKVLDARILVEGSTDPLIQKRSKMEGRIKELEGLLESAKAAETGKGRFESSIDDILGELEELRRLKLIEEDVYKLTAEALGTLRKLCEEITALLWDIGR